MASVWKLLMQAARRASRARRLLDFFVLPALPLLESRALGNALHAFSFLPGLAAGYGLFARLGGSRRIGTRANLRHAFAQRILQLWNAFAGNGRNFVQIQLQLFGMLAQRGDLLRIGNIDLRGD